MLSSLETIFNDYFNCSKCLGRYAGTSNHSRTIALQKSKGCFDNKRLNRIENICYHGCIGNFRDKSVDFFFDLFLKYERGILPYDVPYQNHPNKLIEIFNMIENTKAKYMAEQQKEERRKAKSKKHGR